LRPDWKTAPWIAAALLLAGLSSARTQQNPSPSSADAPTVISMTAKSYDFDPQQVHVKKGARVQLRIRATDRAHGIRFNLYPAGADENGPPGLRFEHPQDEWKLDKDEEREIEFVAERPGTYSFRCSVFCGLGHVFMRGKLIVEE
jgi:cytochrome c oxidase subunit 2